MSGFAFPKYLLICPDVMNEIGGQYNKDVDSYQMPIYIYDDDMLELHTLCNKSYHIPGLYDWWNEFDSNVISYADSTVKPGVDWADWIVRGIRLAHKIKQIIPRGIEVIFITPYEVPKEFQLPDLTIMQSENRSRLD